MNGPEAIGLLPIVLLCCAVCFLIGLRIGILKASGWWVDGKLNTYCAVCGGQVTMQDAECPRCGCPAGIGDKEEL